MEKVHKTRSDKLYKAAVLCVEVEKRKGKVSKTFAKKLEKMLLPLEAMFDDEYFWELAQKQCETIHHALSFIESKEESDREKMIQSHKEADEIAYQIVERRKKAEQ
jgi:hypothetical protein